MRPPGRLVAAACLAVLTLLAVGALVLSLVTAPSEAESRLHQAAAATAGASGFTMAFSAVQGSGSAERAVSADVDYQAPDRVAIAQSPTLGGAIQLALGTRAWISTDGGTTWQRLRARVAGSSIGAQTAAEILAVPRALEGVTGVRAGRGGVLSFTSADPKVVGPLSGQGGVLPAGIRARVAVTVSARGIGVIEVLLSQPAGPATLAEYRFSAVGRGPVLVAPPAASVRG